MQKKSAQSAKCASIKELPQILPIAQIRMQIRIHLISELKGKMPQSTPVFRSHAKKICSICKICERNRTPADYGDSADQDANKNPLNQ